MKLTDNGSRALIETTNRINGCLETGGVCGRQVSYDSQEVANLLGIMADELVNVCEDDEAMGWDSGITIKQAIVANLEGKVVSNGTLIA